MKRVRRERRPAQSATSPDTVVFSLGTEFEEDIESLQALAVSLLGPNGRMVYPVGRNTTPNVVLSTPRHGKLWYGDLDMIAQADALKTLQNKLGTEVAISKL